MFGAQAAFKFNVALRFVVARGPVGFGWLASPGQLAAVLVAKPPTLRAATEVVGLVSVPLLAESTK